MGSTAKRGILYPFVSIIIPVYNGESTLQECLSRLLSQSYPSNRYRILVVDNGSTDSTRKIAESFFVSFLPYCEIQGPSAARNHGIARSLPASDLLLFTDADCLAPKDFILQHVLSHIRQGLLNPRTAAVGGGIKGHNTSLWACCDDICSWFYFYYKLPGREEPFFCPTANLSVDARYIQKYGGFDPTLRYGEDVYFSNILKRNGKTIYFSPGAWVGHMNRKELASFLRHRVDWTISYDLLLEREVFAPSPFTVLSHAGRFFLLRFPGTFLHCLRGKRYSIFLLWPIIFMAQTIEIVCTIIAEKRFKAKRKGHR